MSLNQLLYAKEKYKIVDYEVPEELDFFEHGFGLSKENDPDEGLFSYCYQYKDGKNLIFSHSPSVENSLSVKLTSDEDVIFYLSQEGVRSITFQAWEDEKIIRVYLNHKSNKELRISYNPKPKLYFSEF